MISGINHITLAVRDIETSFDFVNIIKFIYQQPQSVCVRDMVVAPTSYEG